MTGAFFTFHQCAYDHLCFCSKKGLFDHYAYDPMRFFKKCAFVQIRYPPLTTVTSLGILDML